MINRVLIRIRVIQILYASYLNESGDLRKTENDLLQSLQKSYDLYYYLLLLLIEITDAYERRIENKKSKLLPTFEDLNPNKKLINNLFINQLKNNKHLINFLEERPLSWEDNENYIKDILDKILESDIYKSYIEKEETSFEEDRDFWKVIFKKYIYNDVDLDDILEEDSIYWNDDVEIIESFTLKTIKQFQVDSKNNHELLPMFKDEEDQVFAVKLLRESMLRVKETRDLINKYAANWENERIAFMDKLIMQVAITEMLTFPNIPVNVTLNEYINIAKNYSSQKSSSFINGILDGIVKELREEKKLFKK